MDPAANSARLGRVGVPRRVRVAYRLLGVPVSRRARIANTRRDLRIREPTRRALCWLVAWRGDLRVEHVHRPARRAGGRGPACMVMEDIDSGGPSHGGCGP